MQFYCLSFVEQNVNQACSTLLLSHPLRWAGMPQVELLQIPFMGLGIKQKQKKQGRTKQSIWVLTCKSFAIKLVNAAHLWHLSVKCTRTTFHSGHLSEDELSRQSAVVHVNHIFFHLESRWHSSPVAWCNLFAMNSTYDNDNLCALYKYLFQ